MLDEPVLKKKKRRQNKYLYFGIISLFLFIGLSYGVVYFVQEYQGTSIGVSNQLVAFSVTENGAVAMSDADAQKDIEGITNERTTFTITNESQTMIKVEISFVTDTFSTLDNNEVRFAVFESDEIVNLGNLGENNNILYTFELEEGESVSLQTTIWLDYYYEGIGEIFSGKYEVEAVTADEYGRMYLSHLVEKNKGLYALSSSGTLSTGSGGVNEYRYSGLNPDNYLWFNDELWRIIGVVDKHIKIVRNESLNSIAFGSENAYATSTIKNVLNDYYNNTITEFYRKFVAEKTYNVGLINLNDTYADLLTNELATTYTGYIGLINASDFLYSTSTPYYTNALNDINISNNSWLTGTYLTMNGINGNTTNVLGINDNIPTSVSVTDNTYGIRPCLYLNSDIYIVAGNGTQNKPYYVNNEVSIPDEYQLNVTD